MGKSQTVNKYAHLEYRVLHELDISINEYWLLDMVYQLSRDGWCYKSLNSIAKDMKLHKNGVVKMRDRLIKLCASDTSKRVNMVKIAVTSHIICLDLC